jgi:hypothetical protein
MIVRSHWYRLPLIFAVACGSSSGATHARVRAVAATDNDGAMPGGPVAGLPCAPNLTEPGAGESLPATDVTTPENGVAPRRH